MKNPLERESYRLTEDLDIQLLEELERQSIEEIQKLRVHERMDIRIALEIRPANASDRSNYKACGQTADISKGGCRAFFPIPVQVGDVYSIRFDKQVLDLPVIFARCLRCKLLREDSFEAAFSFFTPISLTPTSKPHESLLD